MFCYFWLYCFFYGHLDSHLKVDDAPFVPTKYTDENPTWNITTTFQGEDNFDPGYVIRTFSLVSRHDEQMYTDEIFLEIKYSSSQGKINGTYDIAGNEEVDAYYRSSTAFFHFISGSVTVADLGHNRYSLKFNDVLALDNYDGATKTVSGNFKGTFYPLN